MKNIYEGFNAYKLYLAVKNHFTTNYDFFKYNGKVNAKEDSFLKRRDKFFFAKLQRKYNNDQLRDLFVSNFADGEDFWIGNVLTQKAESVYTEWKARQMKLSYILEQDLKFLLDYYNERNLDFNSLFVMENGHPILLQCVLRNDIYVETMIIIDRVLNYSRRWNKVLDDPVWTEFKKRMDKYSPFVLFEAEKGKKILRKVFVK
jgi:hypothetical protein|tara:strand:- start:438 stop:1046 length:609 start_codon:yes stop_codon:yes gene_type:complete